MFRALTTQKGLTAQQAKLKEKDEFYQNFQPQIQESEQQPLKRQKQRLTIIDGDKAGYFKDFRYSLTVPTSEKSVRKMKHIKQYF